MLIMDQMTQSSTNLPNRVNSLAPTVTPDAPPRGTELSNKAPALPYHQVTQNLRQEQPMHDKQRRYRRVYNAQVDVLSIRGGLASFNPGNQAYLAEARRLNLSGYKTASANEKRIMNLQLVDFVHSRGGEFLLHDNVHGWYEMKPERARKKAAQALRECMTQSSSRRKSKA